MKKNIEHKGSRLTSTIFKKDDFTVKVTVWLESNWIQSNTFFRHSISVKGYKCRTWNQMYTSKECLDKRYLNFITKQELYESYHNHWNKLNPVRMFSSGQINSDIVFNGSITEIESTKNHKAY